MLWGLFGGTARQTTGTILALALGLAGGWIGRGLHNRYLTNRATLTLYNATGHNLEALALVMPDGSSHPLAERLDAGAWHWGRVPRSGTGTLTLYFGLPGEGPSRSAVIAGGQVGRLMVFNDAVALTLTPQGFVATLANLATFRDARRQAAREEWREAIREHLARTSPAPVTAPPPVAPPEAVPAGGR